MAYDFKSIKVLIVESSPHVLALLEDVLSIFTIPRNNISSASTTEEGFKKFCAENHDLVIVDWIEDPTSGIQLTHNIRSGKVSPNPYVPVLMTAGSGHENRVIKARDMGVSGYLVKPFVAKDLAQKIEIIIEKPRPFIVHSSFVGPDRRVGKKPYTDTERRQAAPVMTNPADVQKKKKMRK
jgi:two-component system chemotaxis response regulator CheY